MSKKGWFEVDPEGLTQVVARRGKAFILAELLQNAWDEPGVTRVTASLTQMPGRRSLHVLCVEDDAPAGFEDLAASYTLFGGSTKRGDAERRGRFSLGEKLVLALAQSATIISTKGGWSFDRDGRRALRRRRDAGSQIELVLNLDSEDVAALDRLASLLVPPVNVETYWCGQRLGRSQSVRSMQATLMTEIADGDGCLRRVRRQTTLEFWRPDDGCGWIYEMGIPVVETEDGWSCNVMQKVPLNMERDGVPLPFLRDIRTACLNLNHSDLRADEANATWVREALASKDVSESAVRAAVTARFGEKAVAYDPTDLEANRRAVSEGYTLIMGGHLSGAEWENVRKAGLVPRAGAVAPTKSLYSAGGPAVRIIEPSNWTANMRALAALTQRIASAAVDVHRLEVVYEIEPHQSYGANYGAARVVFNLGRLGKAWPDQGASESVIDLILHELGHEHGGSDHLSGQYYRALTRLAARLALAVRDDPSILDWRDPRDAQLVARRDAPVLEVAGV